MKQQIAVLLIALGFIWLLGGYITGFLVAPATKEVSLNIGPVDFIYNSSEFEISDTIKLKSQAIKTEKNLSNTTDYKITSAYSEPDKDNTDKLKEVDDKEIEINTNKPLYLAFQSELSSGDSISIKINPDKDSVLNICDFDLGCSKKYGSLNYNNSNQSNIITLSNLELPTKNFLLTSTKEIKIDQIKSSKGDLERSIVDPKDRTSKINSQDSDTQNIEDDKLVYIIFDTKIKSGSEIKLYIADGEDSKITACSFPSCSTVYGSVNYEKNQKGFYNITINTDPPTNKIVLKSEKAVDLDYLNVSLTEKWTETTYNTVYPSVASLETKEISVPNLAFWESLKYSKKENNQTIKTFYSTNASWKEIPESGNLSSIDIETKKIKFRINFSTDTKSTSELSNLSLDYIVNLPSYSQQSVIQEASTKGSIVNITLNATNPELIKSIYADVLDSTGKSINKIKLNYSADQKIFSGQLNTTNFKEGVYMITLSIDSDYTELKSAKDMIAIMSDVKGSFSSQPQASGDIFRIDAREKSGTEIELKAQQVNTIINIIQYSKNIKDAYPQEKEIGKYVEIVPQENITGLESAKIKLYYNSTDLSSSGVDENTLSIQYYNEASGVWEKLNSTVNTTGMYVETTTTHFSTYGLFGTQTQSTTAQTAGTQGSSGSYQQQTPIENKNPSSIASTQISPEETKNTKTESRQSTNKTTDECTSSIEIQIPAELSNQEKQINGKIINTGNCDIEQLDLGVTDGIKTFVLIEPTMLGIPKNSEKDFVLKSLDEKTVMFLNPIQGLAIAPNKLSSETLNGQIIIKSTSLGLATKTIDVSIEVPVKVPKENVYTLLIPILVLIAGLILFFVRRK